MEKTQKIKLIIFGALVFVFLGFMPAAAQAASLYFSPSSGAYAIGGTFSVGVYVSSADQAMNAASGVVSFPNDKLEVISLSKSGSILSLWVQEPSFSNNAGTVNFEGIVLNPGFTGASGKLLVVNFRVKAASAATLNFSSGSVFANDGQGTNILAGLGNASFSLSDITLPVTETTEKKVALPPTSGVPVAQKVFSSTHPDSDKWYNNKNPQFLWTLPADANGVSFYLSQSPTSNPGPASDGLLTSKTYENFDDGIWYFHIKIRNAIGWGPITHFKFQIDTESPEPFTIKFVDGKETDNPRPVVLFDTTDALSGIDYYKVKIGEGDFFSLSGAEVVKKNPYTLPLQLPGKRTILVQAYDRAGNYSTVAEEFVIKALESPIITDYPKTLASGEFFTFKGVTKYPDAQINVFLQRDKDESKNYSVKSDKGGKFTFVTEKRLSSGIYTAWAEVIDSRGAKSDPSEKVTISVEQPGFIKIGSWAIGFLAVITPLVALVFTLLFIIWYGWHKFSSLRKRVSKKTKRAERSLHQIFNAMRREIEKQVAKLDGKPDLNEREKKICNSLKKALKISEKFVDKKFKDIEKEIKK